jgi:hypothetical protein
MSDVELVASILGISKEEIEKILQALRPREHAQCAAGVHIRI